jgi:hypothetical protein
MAGKEICFRVKTKETGGKVPERNEKNEFRVKNLSQVMVLKKVKIDKYKPIDADIKVDKIKEEIEEMHNQPADESFSESFEAESYDF